MYCSQDDLLERISEQELVNLTDDDDAGVVDESKLTRAIADADAEIDGYVGKRHPVPLSPVPTLIRKVSVETTIYHLYSIRMGAPPDWKERYDNNVRILKAISSGAISLGADDPDGAPANEPPEVEANDRVFSRDTLKDF